MQARPWLYASVALALGVLIVERGVAPLLFTLQGGWWVVPLAASFAATSLVAVASITHSLFSAPRLESVTTRVYLVAALSSGAIGVCSIVPGVTAPPNWSAPSAGLLLLVSAAAYYSTLREEEGGTAMTALQEPAFSS